MFRPYRTVKIKVPRACCPWCQAHSELIEQKLQALEEKLLELSNRLAPPLAPVNPQPSIQIELQAGLAGLGLGSGNLSSGEYGQFDSASLARAFTAVIAGLDRLAEASVRQAPPSPAASLPNNLAPRQLPQIAPRQNGSKHDGSAGWPKIDN